MGVPTTHTSSMSSKVSSSWSWESLPSFQDFTAAISNPKDMPELDKVFSDMRERLAQLQVPGDMDSTMALMKTNMDKLLELFKEATEKMKDSNNKLIQVTLTMFCDITKELSQKIKDASKESFTQPQMGISPKLPMTRRNHP